MLEWICKLFRKKESSDVRTIIRHVDAVRAVVINRLINFEAKVMGVLDDLKTVADEVKTQLVNQNEKLVTVLELLDNLQAGAGNLTAEQQQLVADVTETIRSMKGTLATQSDRLDQEIVNPTT